MGTDELAFSQEDFLAAAERIAPTRRDRPGVNALSKYLEQYRADAFAEDFAALTTEDAVCLAFDLWEFSREQQDKDKRAIRVRAAHGHDDRPLKTTVAEIVGPDMAFLVDSAIIACQSARIEIRAVLHPVMSTGDAMRSMKRLGLGPLGRTYNLFLTLILVPAMYAIGVDIARFFRMVWTGKKQPALGEHYTDTDFAHGEQAGHLDHSPAE